jgi:hypothetical protein
MNFRTFIAILVAVACGIWDASVASWFPAPFDAVRLALPAAVALAAFSTSRLRTFAVALAGGAAYDALIPSTGGFMTLRLLAVALTVNLLTSKLFTNRTIASAVVIGSAAALADRILLAAFEGAQAIFGRSIIPEARPSLAASAAWTSLVLLGFFFVFAAFGRRFLPAVSREVSVGWADR